LAKLIEISVPDIGDFQGVDVIEVLVREGDRVAVEAPLLTLETDKAAMEIPAPEAGIIRKVKVAVGDKISQGDVIFLLEADKVENTVETTTTPESEEKQAPSEPTPGVPKTETKSSPVRRDTTQHNISHLPLASPAIRRFSRELGVDLDQVRGSGPKDRILKEDIQAHVKTTLKNVSGEGLRPSPISIPEIDFSKFGEVSTESLSRIQKLSSIHLHRSWSMIPHVTQHDEADITKMEAFRKESQGEAEKRGAKMTPVVFLIKACVAAIKKYPQFNASLSEDGETLVLKHYYHIGVAVDTPDGLLVPVLRDCDQKSLLDLAVELGELSQRARNKKLSLDEMQGGSFTISSLGGIGGTAFTPIINTPEVAILGVSRASQKPVYQSGAFVPRLILPFSLSYDHRVIDGAAAVRFTQYLSHLLSDIRGLLL